MFRKIMPISAVAVASVTATATPASAIAANDVVLLDTGSGSYGPNTVFANCQGGPGASLDLNYVTYVVRGTAQASSTSGAIPIATTINCWIRDYKSGAVWGPKVTGFAPTGTAAAAGTITARSTGYLTMCSEAYALFNDNRPAAHYKTPGC
ncbi:MAG TPA: hypothetical protein VNA20_17070 [Frankiaceae bacterium]|nr:hypothetical protein [Frankiaceae bacterium]